MRGMPVTRTTSPDGRWAFTLYDNLGEQPFIHALDTVGRTARCIDLAGLTGFAGLYELQPGAVARRRDALGRPPAGRTAPLAVVDTKTWQVTEPTAHRDPAAQPPAELRRRRPRRSPCSSAASSWPSYSSSASSAS